MQDPKTDRWLATVLVASNFGPPFLFSGVAVALPDLGRELGASATQLGLVETVFLCANLVFLLPLGRLADASDRRACYLLGLIAFVATVAATAFAGSIETILVLRVLQGLASALYAATGFAVLADLTPPERRGRVFGAAIGVTYAGLACGPLVAGHLVRFAGWRAVFGFGAAAIAACAVVVIARLPRRWRMPTEWPPWGSTALLLAGGTAAVVGSASAGQRWVAATWIAAAAGAAVGFVRLQFRSMRPLLDVRALLANRPLRQALLVQFLLYGNAFCATLLVSLWLQAVRGRSADEAGLWLAVGSASMVVVAPLAGRLTDRIGPDRVAAAGALLVVASSCCGLGLAAGASAWFAVVVTGLQSTGFALFSTPNTARILGSLPKSSSGLASSLAALARSVGMVAGMLVTNAAIAIACGDGAVTANPDGVEAALRSVYAVLCATSALALVVSVSALRRRSA